MISNQILQSTIDGLKSIARIDLCVIDTEGMVLASTFPGASGKSVFQGVRRASAGIRPSCKGDDRGCVYGRQDRSLPDTKSPGGI